MEGLSAAWPEFTVAQVAAHNKPDDCWVVVDGWVCDVTAYMAVHPGGKQLIARSAGLDVTRDFAAMFHSSRARTKMLELVVGNDRPALRGGVGLTVVPEQVGWPDRAHRSTWILFERPPRRCHARACVRPKAPRHHEARTASPRPPPSRCPPHAWHCA